MDDKLILDLLKDNNPRALSLIYKKYGEAHFKMVVGLLRNEEDAKDVIQEFMLSLWESRVNLIIETSFKSYLFSALRYRSINFLKANLTRLKVTQDLDSFNECALHENFVVYSKKNEMKELQELIEEKIDQLPEKLKQTFRLSRIEGMTNMEIAEHTGFSHQTVRNRISMSIQILKSQFKSFFFFF